MKKSIIAAVILVACLLLAPFGFGRLAEKRVNSVLDAVVEQVPYLVIAERTWEAGWFRSRQTVKLELVPALRTMMGQAAAQAVPGQSMPALPTGFAVHNEVVHGPVLGKAGFGLARVDTTIDLPEEVVAEIRKLFGPKPALELYSTLGFVGGGKTVLTSEGRTIRPEGKDAEIVYDTFKLVVGLGRNADTYEVEGGLPQLELKGADGATVRLAGLTFDGEGERVKGQLYDGDMAIKLRELSASGAAGTETSVADIHYIVDSDTDGDFVTLSAKMGSGAVKSADVEAIGLEISEIHYDFAFRRLHADTVEKIISSMRDIYTAMPAQANPMATALELQARFFAPLKEHGIELLKHDPEFAFERVGLVTPQGEGVLRGTVKLVGVTADDLTAAGLPSIAGKIEAEITLEVAQALVEKIPNGGMVVGMGIDAGYLVREGDKLVSHIELKGGELKINGKVQELPAIPGMGGVAPSPPAPGPVEPALQGTGA
jgi:uncharacterized protein YdgA (DUF945 family)